jgi:predicted nucleotidyltransferase
MRVTVKQARRVQRLLADRTIAKYLKKKDLIKIKTLIQVYREARATFHLDYGLVGV